MIFQIHFCTPSVRCCKYEFDCIKYLLFNTYLSYYLLSSVFYCLIYVDMAALK